MAGSTLIRCGPVLKIYAMHTTPQDAACKRDIMQVVGLLKDTRTIVEASALD